MPSWPWTSTIFGGNSAGVQLMLSTAKVCYHNSATIYSISCMHVYTCDQSSLLTVVQPCMQQLIAKVPSNIVIGCGHATLARQLVVAHRYEGSLCLKESSMQYTEKPQQQLLTRQYIIIMSIIIESSMCIILKINYYYYYYYQLVEIND